MKKIVEWVENELEESIEHLCDIEFYLKKQEEEEAQLGNFEEENRLKAKIDQIGYSLAILDHILGRLVEKQEQLKKKPAKK